MKHGVKELVCDIPLRDEIGAQLVLPRDLMALKQRPAVFIHSLAVNGEPSNATGEQPPDASGARGAAPDTRVSVGRSRPTRDREAPRCHRTRAGPEGGKQSGKGAARRAEKGRTTVQCEGVVSPVPTRRRLPTSL